MNLAIDATTMIEGGGLKYLNKLLENFSPKHSKFKKIVVFVDSEFKPDFKVCEQQIKLNFLPKKAFFGVNLIFWKIFVMRKKIYQDNCKILFALSTYNFSFFYPFVSIIHNQLPFQNNEIKRYGISFKTIKFLILKFLFSFFITKSSGLILLSNYSKEEIAKKLKFKHVPNIVIPHGLDDQDNRIYFNSSNKKIFNEERPFRIIYLSNFEPYKNHDAVAKAVDILRKEGLPIEVNFVGRLFNYGKKIKRSFEILDPPNNFLIIHGWKKKSEVEMIIKESDLMIFASSCKSFGQIVLESMRWGIPIICSENGPMKEILGKVKTEYFDPMNTIDISKKIQYMFENNIEREKLSDDVYKRSLDFNWNNSIKETLSFIANVEIN